jgi:hypothetical protein
MRGIDDIPATRVGTTAPAETTCVPIRFCFTPLAADASTRGGCELRGHGWADSDVQGQFGWRRMQRPLAGSGHIRIRRGRQGWSGREGGDQQR